MPRGEVASFIPKNIITRSLGPRADVQIDLEGPFPLAVGDVFMLCSDGLSGQIKDEEIGAILSTLSPDEAVRALVDMANLRGGPDNVTALVAKVLHVPDDQEGDSTEAVASGESPSTPIAQFLWVLMALGLLMAVLLAASGNMPAALASGLLAAAAAVVAMIVGLLKALRPRMRTWQDPWARVPMPSTMRRRIRHAWPSFARWPNNCARRPKTNIGRSTGPSSTPSESKRKRRWWAGTLPAPCASMRWPSAS